MTELERSAVTPSTFTDEAIRPPAPEGSREYFYAYDSRARVWRLYTPVGELTHAEFTEMDPSSHVPFPPLHAPRFGVEACYPFHSAGRIYAWRNQPRWVLTELPIN